MTPAAFKIMQIASIRIRVVRNPHSAMVTAGIKGGNASHDVVVIQVATDEGIEGAALVQFFNRPNDRVCFIMAIGGKLVTNDGTFEQLKNYAASNGATCIEGAARESIARLWTRYGLTEKYRIVGVKL